MQPIRVKVYGFISLTKRTYLTVQVIGVIVFLALAAGVYLLPRPQPPTGAELSPWLRVCVQLLDNIPWIVLVALVLEGIETYFVLRRFARQEALQKATAPATQPTP